MNYIESWVEFCRKYRLSQIPEVATVVRFGRHLPFEHREAAVDAVWTKYGRFAKSSVISKLRKQPVYGPARRQTNILKTTATKVLKNIWNDPTVALIVESITDFSSLLHKLNDEQKSQLVLSLIQRHHPTATEVSKVETPSADFMEVREISRRLTRSPTSKYLKGIGRRRTSDEVQQLKRSVLQVLKHDPLITAKEIAAHLRLKPIVISRPLRLLVKEGTLASHGIKQGMRYELRNSNEKTNGVSVTA